MRSPVEGARLLIVVAMLLGSAGQVGAQPSSIFDFGNDDPPPRREDDELPAATPELAPPAEAPAPAPAVERPPTPEPVKLPDVAKPEDTPKVSPPARPRLAARRPAARKFLNVPDPAAQAKARDALRVSLAQEYQAVEAKADEAQPFAERLRARAAETDEPVRRFMLLREARRFFFRAQNLKEAFSVTDEIAERYSVDAMFWKIEPFKEAARRTDLPVTLYGSLAGEGAQLLRSAVDSGDFEAAERLSRQLLAIARKSKSQKSIAEVQAQFTDVRWKVEAYGRAKPFKARLTANPNDPAANLAQGLFVCFALGDWEKGLPMLAKGSDPRFKAVAIKELAGPTDPKSEAAVGDGWWQLGSESKQIAPELLKDRACLWYERALPGLSGPEQQRVQKRIAAQAAPPVPEDAPKKEKRPKNRAPEKQPQRGGNGLDRALDRIRPRTPR